MTKPIVPLKVIARSPFKLYYEGKAMALSATNRIGRFDVMPGHADFFSVLLPGDVIIDIMDPPPVKLGPNGEPPEENKDEKPVDPNGPFPPLVFKISNGIVTVRDDEVMLFCNM